MSHSSPIFLLLNQSIGKLFYFLHVFISVTVFAQYYTISGYVDDAITGERLISATIYDTISKRGVLTNVHGFYSISLPQGKAILRFSYAGYQPVFIPVHLKHDTIIHVKLASTTLSEVVISAEKTIVDDIQMSSIILPLKNVQKLPVLLGERDILKMIQLFPGIQTGTEGTTGLYVRGGGPDQNLILLDGVPVYNVDHLFGFFSVFHPDAIQHIQVFKGGFPARYGGRLSSVIDIRMKEGNKKKYTGSLNTGIVSTSIALEGPIKKDTASFMFTARRTYIDLLTIPIFKMVNPNTTAGYFFYDLNLKTNYIISSKDHIFLSIYTGKDKAYLKYKDTYQDITENIKSSLEWGNVTTAFRWNRMIHKKLFSNVTLTLSRFQFEIEQKYSEHSSALNTENTFAFKYFSGIYDWAIKTDLEYYIRPGHKMTFGFSDIYHTFLPGVSTFSTTGEQPEMNTTLTFGNRKIYAHEMAAFVEDEISLAERWLFHHGIRFSAFPVQDTFYYSVEPRINARYRLNNQWALKSSYVFMKQYILLLTNSTIGLPTDLWLPVTKKIHPMNAWQVAAGVFHLYRNTLELSVEGYFKKMKNVIEYKEGASFFTLADSWENKITAGSGTSYGVEFFIKKDAGNTTGWIGYTLSWTTRLFKDLNMGKPFPYKYDRRHDIGIALSHQFSENIDAGIVWVYGTGTAFSLPIETYPSASFTSYFFIPEVQYYEGRNQFRAPAYHRLDLGVNIHQQYTRSKHTWSFYIYNLYNRKNPFVIMFTTDHTSGRKRLTQFSLFPLIPSISYSLKF